MPAHPAFDRRVPSPVYPQHRVLVTQLLLYGVPERVRSFHRSLLRPSHVLALLFGSFPAPISISTAEVPSMATVRSGGTIPTRSRPCLSTPIDPLTLQQTVGNAGGSSTVFARPIPLTVGNASNVLIEDLTQIGSPSWVRRILPAAEPASHPNDSTTLSTNPPMSHTVGSIFLPPLILPTSPRIPVFLLTKTSYCAPYLSPRWLGHLPFLVCYHPRLDH